MAVRVRFFASLAEAVGQRHAEHAWSDDLTVRGVWRELTGEADLPSGVLCAVNHSYCDVDQVLEDEDEVAYFPPVTGG